MEKINILKSNHISFFNSNKSKQFSIVLNIILNNYCNLNCTECQAFCDTNNSIDFLSLIELKELIPLIKSNFSITKIILLGGEPLLHPNIIEICNYLINEFKNIDIIIFTNGILAKDIVLKNYSIFKNSNIIFEFSIYPIINIINEIKNLEQLEIKTITRNIRPIFNKITFNKQGENNKDKFFLCGNNYNTPIELFMNHEKLFKCPLPAYWHLINLPITTDDYLNIKNLNQKNIIKYFSNSLIACKYCGSCTDEKKLENNSEDFIFWHRQKDISNDYFHSLFYYYLYNYNTYYNYCHSCKEIIPLLKDPYFLSKHFEEGYSINILNILQIRFFIGKKDIFIPFSANITNNDIQILKQKLFLLNDFLKINFYFVSIDKDIKSKEKMYKNFLPFSKSNYGNFYFLEANNLQEGYCCFLENSYLNIKDSILYLNKN